MPRIFWIVLLLLLLVSADPTLALEVYASPEDDGLGPMQPVAIAIGGGLQTTLHLYLDHGDGSGPSLPGTECSGTGTGAEVCMWDLQLDASGAVSLIEFIPDPAVDAIWGMTSTRLRVNGGDPVAGSLGPLRIGQLVVEATDPGEIRLAGRLWIDSQLNRHDPTMTEPLAVACANEDGDFLCDASDPCRSYANAFPMLDADLDGIPNECQCGDANENGVLSFADGQLIVLTVQGTANADPTIADTNGNGVLSFADGLAVIQTVQGVIPDAFTLTCPRRPEGTAPPQP